MVTPRASNTSLRSYRKTIRQKEKNRMKAKMFRICSFMLLGENHPKREREKNCVSKSSGTKTRHSRDTNISKLDIPFLLWYIRIHLGSGKNCITIHKRDLIPSVSLILIYMCVCETFFHIPSIRSRLSCEAMLFFSFTHSLRSVSLFSCLDRQNWWFRSHERERKSLAT